MPLCENPECQKDVPEDHVYCNGDCLKRHLELKRLARGEMNLTQEDDIWLGQSRRRRAMEVISRLAKELCPMSYKKFVSMVSYRTGLSRRKVADDYIVVLLDVGILEIKEGTLSVVE
ncbi:MAG: hypothetical protein ACFFCW_30080 [Candidatus Hodarchaeota archaeon]